ncbi:MAG: geranylgeranyl reductase family protein [Candidatus Lokiarchaeota archaeon]|nr:geranylgeranyl reductase family protein [Candidatus Lokiarchaeota archaeon]
MAKIDYDVIVVGAGPAGSTTARILSENDIRVGLLDRRKEIGMPIQCGEYFPTPGECSDIFPNSPRAKRIATIPDKLITNRTYWTHLISPRGNITRFRFNANIIDRARFDKHLVKRAVEQGAELHLQFRVLEKSESNRLLVKTNRGTKELAAKYIVGADGPKSIISQSIGNFHSNSQFSQSIQFVLDDTACDQSVTEMYFGQQVAPGGYAWIIPKGGGSVNLGLGLRQFYNERSLPLRVFLKNLMKRNPLIEPCMRHASLKHSVSALIPIGGPASITATKNTLLVGDAAGHVMASNGGGIPTAIIGGEIAAESIIDSMDTSSSLSNYEIRWKREMGQTLFDAVKVREIADKILSNDLITHLSMGIAGPFLLEPLIRCRLPFPVLLGSKIIVPLMKILD